MHVCVHAYVCVCVCARNFTWYAVTVLEPLVLQRAHTMSKTTENGMTPQLNLTRLGVLLDLGDHCRCAKESDG